MNPLLLGRAPGLDKAVVATCLSSLESRTRPAIFISMLVVAGLSGSATHTLGGPLRRADSSQVAAQLDDLAETLRPSRL